MIIGIGTDIIEINRIEKALNHTGFLSRYFTNEEIKFFETKKNSLKSIAANFAAKEAVSKAMGTGFSGFGAEEIEILRDCKGKPFVKLRDRADAVGSNLGIKAIHLSLSHCEAYAVAYVVAEGDTSL